MSQDKRLLLTTCHHIWPADLGSNRKMETSKNLLNFGRILWGRYDRFCLGIKILEMPKGGLLFLYFINCVIRQIWIFVENSRHFWTKLSNLNVNKFIFWT